MKIFVNIVSGVSLTLHNRPDHIITLEVEPTDTIADVKNQIYDMEQIPVNEQFLIFADEHLVNDQNLSEYNIQNESTLLLICLPTRFVMAIVIPSQIP